MEFTRHGSGQVNLCLSCFSGSLHEKKKKAELSLYSILNFCELAFASK